jgi:hypothetical protein
MRNTFLTASFLFLLASCAPLNVTPATTQLQLREFQSREFYGQNPTLLLKALVDVLQDDDFIIQNAVVDLGVITASKEIDIENASEAFFSRVFGGDDARWQKHSVIEASVNVSPRGGSTRVRVVFQKKTFDNRGAVLSVERIDDFDHYQEFFSRVDKGIFLAVQGI